MLRTDIPSYFEAQRFKLDQSESRLSSKDLHVGVANPFTNSELRNLVNGQVKFVRNFEPADPFKVAVRGSLCTDVMLSLTYLTVSN